jgi:putative tryptophan/tyrosine transport system substrate-binding protein
MTRRAIGLIVTLALAVLVALLAAEAQPPTKVYRVGSLRIRGSIPEDSAQFREEMRRLGYVPGHDLFFEPAWAETPEQLPARAAELVARRVDLIMSFGLQATRAAQQATATIPILFIVNDDPVHSGLVASYARPGGNLTGLVRGSYEDKLLELLKEAVPSIVRVACPCRNRGPSLRVDAARRLGLELLDLDGLALQDFDPQQPDAWEGFFAAARRAGADAILVPEGLGRHHARLGELAAQSRLPAIAPRRRFAASGGLLAYEAQQDQSQGAVLLDKMLKGAKPADIPVEHAMRFELVINLQTAEALGLTMPPTFLFQATEVIRGTLQVKPSKSVE